VPHPGVAVIRDASLPCDHVGMMTLGGYMDSTAAGACGASMSGHLCGQCDIDIVWRHSHGDFEGA
jgi:hypothetical protein